MGKRSRLRKLWADWESTRFHKGAVSSPAQATPSAPSASPQPPASTSPATQSKYRNRRTKGFASKKEAQRYQELLLLVKAGKIERLQTQVPFELRVNNVLVCKYLADFCYFENGADVVEDAKGYRTPIYRLKAKLMRAVHGITIRET